MDLNSIVKFRYKNIGISFKKMKSNFSDRILTVFVKISKYQL